MDKKRFEEDEKSSKFFLNLEITCKPKNCLSSVKLHHLVSKDFYEKELRGKKLSESIKALQDNKILGNGDFSNELYEIFRIELKNQL